MSCHSVHVILRLLNLRFLRYMESHDVASIICLALRLGSAEADSEWGGGQHDGRRGTFRAGRQR
jgi:hypothetical protein